MLMDRAITPLAKVISWVTHPLLMLTYMLVILLLVDPFTFGISTISDPPGKLLLLRVFLSSFFIPAFAVLMLRLTGLVKSLELPEREDRIGPYIITGMFYIWMFRNFYDNTNIPSLFTSVVLGATIALFVAFFVNIFSKISAHAVGIGGLLGLIVLLLLTQPANAAITWSMNPNTVISMNLTALLLGGILLAGLVGTSRLWLKAHVPIDLLGGYLVGFLAQFVAFRFILL